MGRWSSSPVALRSPSRSALSADSREVNCAAAAAQIAQPNESQTGKPKQSSGRHDDGGCCPPREVATPASSEPGTVEVAAPTRLGTRWEPAALYRALGRCALLSPERAHLRKPALPLGGKYAAACLGVKGSRVQIPPSRRFFERMSDQNEPFCRSQWERNEPWSFPLALPSGTLVTFEVSNLALCSAAHLPVGKFARSICAQHPIHRRLGDDGICLTRESKTRSWVAPTTSSPNGSARSPALVLPGGCLPGAQESDRSVQLPPLRRTLAADHLRVSPVR